MPRSHRATPLATLLATLAMLALPAPATAQVRDSTRTDTVPRSAADILREAGREIPPAVARRVVDIYNAPGTLRASGSLTIDSARTVDGDVAMFGGTLTIAGRVTGNVVAINADVALEPGARVSGDLTVVGGRVTPGASAAVAGTVTAYSQTLAVHEDGEQRLALAAHGDSWIDKWRTRHARSASGVRLTSAGTYNRVEGLPIYFGPTLRQRRGWGRVSADLFGIYRTAARARWDGQNIGHLARADVAMGDRRTLAVGGRLFDIVTAVEDWHLTDTENALSTFFLHRDFRDHFDRHGGTVYARAAAGDHAELTASFSDQRWGARSVRDAWTLVRDDDPWRANPLLDEGRFHLAGLALRVDTRNDPKNPWAGWYVQADYERGTGELTRLGARSDPAEMTPGRLTWQRGFVDARRYNRIAPSAQLNMRLVLGGALDGRPLPLNRRFSVGGPGTLPGYDFRRDAMETLSCSRGALSAGRPAECERIALAQLEYQSDLELSVGGRWGRGDDALLRRRYTGSWIVFADAGRGWLVGAREGEAQYPTGSAPSLGTFRTDLGTGFQFNTVGLFIAKSVSDADEPPNVYLRVRRRF